MMTVRHRAATKVGSAARGSSEYDTTASSSDRQPCTTPASAEYTHRWHALLQHATHVQITFNLPYGIWKNLKLLK